MNIFLIFLIGFFLIFVIYLLVIVNDYIKSFYHNIRKIIIYVLSVFTFIGSIVSGFFSKPIPLTDAIDCIPLITFLICMVILFVFVINDKLWNFISHNLFNGIRYIFGYFRISVLKSFYFQNKSFTLEFINENWQNNIYCFNNKNQVCLIREIDNMAGNTSFMKILYENFFNGEETTLNYKKFIDFANDNEMFIRTYTVSVSKLTKHINNILKKNNIFIEPKKLNINTATEQEITNLPFINIIHTKKITKHIEENGSFKSFWDFALFMNLRPNQGEILSKLVFVKPLKENIKSENKKKFDKKLDI